VFGVIIIIMKIFLGSDHAGLGHKEKIKAFLAELGHEVVDKGAFEYNEEDDYPDFIIPVAREVSQNPNEVRGIVFGGSGQGEAMTANKFSHVRATVFYGEAKYIIPGEQETIISISRQDNDSNILSIGCRFVTEEQAKDAVAEWLKTAFKNTEKYIRRNTKMDRIHE
jgi:ribose 5-phosphate isomerase B